jgi:hypothetical protein
MKKLVGFILLALLVTLALVVPVSATKPTPVEGWFEILGVSPEGCELLQVYGYFEGTLAECPRAGQGAALGYFEGTASGYSGTLVFNLVPFGRNGLGQWTILGGTGELANLSGQGLSYPDGTYDGRVHFDP